jgi:hypothetical protein
MSKAETCSCCSYILLNTQQVTQLCFDIHTYISITIIHYLDQQVHNISTMKPVSYPTCLDVLTSSSGNLLLYTLKLQNQ